MPPIKPSKNKNQPLIEGGSEKPSALRRAQSAAKQVVSRHLKPRVGRAVDALAPAVEKGARAALLQLADPARARILQKSMAGLAQWTMNTGFELDPHARLLFDFVDALEKKEHSREVLLAIIARHASRYEREMLGLMLKATRGAATARKMGPLHGDLPDFLKELLGFGALDPTQQEPSGEYQNSNKAAEDFRRQRDHLSDLMLEFLCELAALESDQTPPGGRAAQLRFFADAPIDARFKPLAGMAVGDAEAFGTGAKNGMPGENPPGEKVPAESSPGGMLARFIPSLSDPMTRFLTTSHLFFLQSYLMRTTIEGLPEMLATVADLEREIQRNQGPIMTMDPPDEPKK